MKKIMLFVIFLLIVCVFLGGFIISSLFGPIFLISWESSEKLNLTSSIDYLESCRENIDLFDETGNDSLRYSYCVSNARDTIPSQEEIEKFKLLNNKQILEVCEYGSFNCNFEKSVKFNCEELWKISYDSLAVRPHTNVFSVNKCGKNYYLYYQVSRNGPVSNKIDLINLDEDTVNLLL